MTRSSRRGFMAGALCAGAFGKGVLAGGNALKEIGPVVTDWEFRRAKGLIGRKAAMYIDDVIWVFRDLARQRPKSMFENPLLGALKEAHDRYGLKVQLNCFYRTDFFYGMDEFSLADMTDAYKDEWQASKDWLRLGFHSYQEFPDYPFVNSSYDDVATAFDRVFSAVRRFAGDGVFTYALVGHWLPFSKDGMTPDANSPSSRIPRQHKLANDTEYTTMPVLASAACDSGTELFRRYA